MKKNSINLERVASAVGFLFLLTAGIVSLFTKGCPNSILEKVVPTAYFIPCVHFFCSAWALLVVFIPNDRQYIWILSIESVLTILINYTQLGIFLFYASVLIILSKSVYTRNSRVKYVIILLSSVHLISLVGTYTFGVDRMIIYIASTIFSAAVYLWIYYILKAKFSCFLPQVLTQNSVLGNIKSGSIVKLSDYNLNERQISFVIENLHNNLSYKDISDKYYVSLSLVKKVFAEVYKIFNVTKLEELRILLLQYQIEK